MENVALRNKLADLAEFRACLPAQPYSIVLRLKLALGYKQLGYPDLAAGDAYKALLLVDEITEGGEYHEETLSAAKLDIASNQAADFASEAHSKLTGLDPTLCCCLSKSSDQEDNAGEDGESETVTWAKGCWSKTAHGILIGCLVDCGCLRTALDYNTRALSIFGQNPIFHSYQDVLVNTLRMYFEFKGENFDVADVEDYPDKGLVRREVYPWNDCEPDRFSPESLQFLNDEMAKVAPKLEVKVAHLPILTPWTIASIDLRGPLEEERYVKQLGIFAKEDIKPGEVVLREKSLLTAVSRLHESFCDACSISLPTLAEDTSEIRACEDCDDTYFCSAECQDLAQTMYHPALCGMSIDEKVPLKEASDFLYTRLLVRALALAETQELHPLRLKEVRYIWGDYHDTDIDRTWSLDPQGNLIDPFGSIPQTLPFSFKSNILTPLNILEKMDVNIFEQSDRYDTWVFNTLYGKFRGTASARQGLDGRPEISAVHPMWCLANHSCDPNVAWDWQGSIKFWAREQLVQWEGRHQDLKPGILKGQELFSHYCDVRLPVKERREWAVGALGGDCMCPRCIWEEAEEKQREASSEL